MHGTHAHAQPVSERARQGGKKGREERMMREWEERMMREFCSKKTNWICVARKRSTKPNQKGMQAAENKNKKTLSQPRGWGDDLFFDFFFLNPWHASATKGTGVRACVRAAFGRVREADGREPCSAHAAAVPALLLLLGSLSLASPRVASRTAPHRTAPPHPTPLSTARHRSAPQRAPQSIVPPRSLPVASPTGRVARLAFRRSASS